MSGPGAVPGAGACAAIVRRDDPALFAAAMAAREPVRGRLMILYAVDVELSRAARVSTESLIPRMRLQFWRDVAEGAGDPGADRAHEVAGPWAMLIRDAGLPAAETEALVAGYEAGLGAPLDGAGFALWAQARFGARLRLGCRCAGGEPPAATCALAAQALAAGFALRTAAALARAGRPTLLPGLAGSPLGALERGEADPALLALVRETAADALGALDRARAGRRAADRGLAPVFLPVLREERALRAVVRDPAAVLGQIDGVDRPFDGLRLYLRALRGRW